MDTIYENLSYCASLHQEEGEDDYMDEDDIYQDDEDDHEGLYADADIQGGYIPKSSSTTAIGHQTDEPVPAIDLQSGEWFTGNTETDAAFELSEQGQVTIARIEQSRKEMLEREKNEALGKRTRDGGEEEEEEEGDEEMGEEVEATEEEQQEARSKMWRAY